MHVGQELEIKGQAFSSVYFRRSFGAGSNEGTGDHGALLQFLMSPIFPTVHGEYSYSSVHKHDPKHVWLRDEYRFRPSQSPVA